MDRSILTRPAPEPDAELHDGHQVADVWRPATAGKPLLVLLHGGFWRPGYDRRHTRILCRALRDAGWPVVAPEYRRTPGRPGHTVADVRAAVSVLPARLSATTTILIGHSAGGHLALWAAATCPPPGLLGTLALAPVADLAMAHEARLDDDAVADFLGGPPTDHRDLDPRLLPSPGTPVVLLHGEADTVVPAALSRSYAAAHPVAELVTLPGTGHFELIDPDSAAWAAVHTRLTALSA
ncbi:alpha/beta hydrolase [Amycolatopsis granulosa]|uniref:alpha/beta hydrolase family protein n=1 Tax=Amycolatopsis granulosa TaxID=185684 RepID=UPI00312C9272|nr:pimeloyl-ACP methyl ester carboxylesterase [Amycolatopsis granulosa]